MDNKIRPEELRIGNLVGLNLKDFPQNFFRMVEVSEHACVATSGIDWHPLRDREYYECEDFEGIPLSEEWLIRGGFQVEKKITWSFGYQKEYKVYSLGNLTYNGIQAQWWYQKCILKNQPRFVHRLQNLVFELEGQELKFNDPST